MIQRVIRQDYASLTRLHIQLTLKQTTMITTIRGGILDSLGGIHITADTHLITAGDGITLGTTHGTIHGITHITIIHTITTHTTMDHIQDTITQDSTTQVSIQVHIIQDTIQDTNHIINQMLVLAQVQNHRQEKGHITENVPVAAHM